MSVINSTPLLMGEDGYQISRSVRLRSSASAYFNRTFVTPTSNTTWSWSGWVKLGQLGTTRQLFGGAGTNYGSFGIESTDKIRFWNNAGTGIADSTAVFRDPSAWYHIVVISNGTTIKAYVNNSEVLSYTGTITNINSAIGHQIGRFGGLTYYTDGYLTEVTFIDGQALTPSSFGETDAVTGVWKPKKYAGTYGTNGFYLNFSDNSNNTAATIGKDYSGNGNNWTPNNISVTSGVTYDSMLDVPTMWADGGNGRGNYAVLNPLGADSPSSTTANGNLTLSNSASNQKRATIPVVSSDTNKYYWEVTVNGTATGNFPNMGMYVVGAGTNWVGYDGNSIGLYQGGGLYYNGSLVATLTSFANGDVIGIAYDPVTGKIWFAKNGTWMASGVPSTGTSPNYTLPTGVDRVAGGYTGSGYGTLEFNFGQRPFTYTPPTGFKALNTQNLPDATIKKGNQYFDVSTWTGDQAARTITNSGAFQPDLIWTKSRSDAESHRLHDAIRGGNGTVLYELNSNETAAEGTDTLVSGVASNGFTIASGTNSPNITGRTYAAWQWKESVTAGFDIVTFTNPSSGSSSFSHSLGVKPSMIIVKARSNTSNWTCTHKSLGTNMADKWINLESTAAVQTSSNIWGGEPTSSVFYCGTGIQVASATMVAYLFAEVAGFSKFGSYTGNGSADGPFVYTGFRPRWVMVKRTDAVADWYVIDTSRDTYNLSSAILYPNLSNAEASNGLYDYLSNGFKLRNAGSAVNASGGTYIYAAFAENPFKNSLAR